MLQGSPAGYTGAHPVLIPRLKRLCPPPRVHHSIIPIRRCQRVMWPANHISPKRTRRTWTMEMRSVLARCRVAA